MHTASRHRVYPVHKLVDSNLEDIIKGDHNQRMCIGDIDHIDIRWI